MRHLDDIRDLAALEQSGWSHRMEALVASGTPLNADTASFSGAMKTKFLGPIRDGLAKGKVLLFGGDDSNPEGFQGILRSAEGINFVGNDFRIPLKATRNQAVGFRSEGETLMMPGAGTYTYLTEPMRSAYGVFSITGQLLKASESNEGAFAQAFKAELEDTVLSSKLDFNRAAYGNGTGVMATVRTSSTPTTTLDVDTTINFRGGEVVDIVVIATGVVVAAARTVTGIAGARSALQLTVSPSIGVALTTGTHGLVRASSDSSIGTPNNSWNKEIQGLTSIIGTGTLHGVVPGTYPFWQSTVTAVGGAIADSVFRAAMDNVGFESGVDLDAGNDFAIVTTRGIRRRYADTLLSVKRFTNVDATTLRGGFKVLEFDGMPIFVDDQCPVGNVFGLSLKDLFWAQESDWEWMEEDGNVLKQDPRKDRYIAYLFAYKQLGATRRNSSFRLTGVTDDVR
jgi:hypothetical protein